MDGRTSSDLFFLLFCVGFMFLFAPFATLDQSTSEDFLSDGKCVFLRTDHVDFPSKV